jgi:hypothetical protein
LAAELRRFITENPDCLSSWNFAIFDGTYSNCDRLAKRLRVKRKFPAVAVKQKILLLVIAILMTDLVAGWHRNRLQQGGRRERGAGQGGEIKI